MSLNIGCGDSTLGTYRIDITRESTANTIGSASNLPYKDGVFPHLRAENVLEHVPNPLEFLRECHRVLGTSGTFWIVTDNAGYRGWFPLLHQFQDRHGTYSNPRTTKDRHYAIFTQNHVRNLMELAGFQIIKIELRTRWKPTLIQRILTFLSPTIGHSHIFVLATKGDG